MTEIREVVLGFFRSLKCIIDEKEGVFTIKNIPEKFERAFSLKSSCKLCFIKEKSGTDIIFIDENSDLIRKMKDYLKNSSTKTLLKLDFDLPANIKDKIRLRNCSLSKIEKKQENNYFSRFSFLTNLRSLNKTDQVSTEIYVHEGKIVNGDLNNYNVHEGDAKEASTEHLEKDYAVAKEKVKDVLKDKIAEMSIWLNEKLQKETDRIDLHYNQILKEFELNKKRLLERMKEAELNNDFEKLAKQKELFEQSFSEKDEKKIKNERDVVVENEKSKYSLDIDNKLINTTIIYYPVFRISLTLNEAGFNKNVELIYNPLTEEMSSLNCDSCKTNLDQVNVCHGGHICCSSCLHLCAECGKRYCRLCLVGICGNCGKLVCKNCARKCSDCGKMSCKNCMRKIGLTGMEKCSSCVVYCPGCSNIVDKKRLVRGSNGSMVCPACIRKK
ncbi:hypothetical protein KA107_03610 [Candidatus Pacearchaeota archaeon]|nr:hypothetical protein [Candidatus Pacearchaeota archaeon]